MIRMTLVLCAALYLVMTLAAAPEARDRVPPELASEAFEPRAIAASQNDTDLHPDELSALPALTITGPGGLAIMVEEVLDPAVTRGRLIRVARAVRLDEVDAAAEAIAAEEAPSADIRYVTGAAVNMRGAPSTGNNVLAVLDRGTEVAVVAETGTGWTQIRLPDTGETGFMSRRYLSATQP